METESYNTSNSTNFSLCDPNRTQYDVWLCLDDQFGPQSISMATAIPLTILNVIIFVTGLVGNISVCLVIVKHSNLHTVTNYYLFNLAISDLTLLIFGLPYDVSVYWHQYPWILGNAFCKIRALISEWASYVSVLTIVAFSTERYFSICYPLYLYTMGGFQRAIKIISAIWLLSFFAALPFSFYTRVKIFSFDGHFIQESAFCGMLDQPPFPLSALSTVIFFLIPMVVIIVEYSMMGYKIANRSNLQFGGECLSMNNVHRDRSRTQSHKAIIRMLAVVVVAFFICWAPFHAQRLNYRYGRDSEYFNVINEWMYFITGLLYYFSSTLNPILYNVMSHRYRSAFREILCGAAPNTNNSIIRNSTIRDTSRLPSAHSERYCVRNGSSINHNHTTVEDEPMVVQNREIRMGQNTQLICELNYSVLSPMPPETSI